MSIREITAPYNFVPLSGWIYQPKNDWQQQVSHDIPLENGLSGTLDITLTAHSDILVGQKQVPANKERPGQVHFFEQNDRYAIPGSSLKGMIRNVLEIASFAKMRNVDDHRLSIRDISGGGHLKDIYASRMQNQKAGFLRLRKQTGEDNYVAEIIPCDYAHIRHNDLKKSINHSDCLFRRGQSVRQKYLHWSKLTNSDSNELPKLRFITQKQPKQTHITLAIPRESAAFEGTLVFTGQISDKCKSPNGKFNKSGKYRDFVFYNDNPQGITLPVDGKLLEDFRKIHGEGETKNKTPWEDFWKKRFKEGEAIPVFYHASGERVKSIGLAFMYKLAYENSIGETLAHTHPLHHYDTLKENDLESLDKNRDLPELLLGMIDPEDNKKAKENHSLKSRISFGLCSITDTSINPKATKATILNGPKATYFPNYLHQQTINNRLAPKKPYTTYMDRHAELRGWKRYPARSENQVKVQSLEGKQKENKLVQVILNPLPANTQFKGKIRFHNIRPEELGALIWALEWGGEKELMHSLGMGKPFGFGQLTIAVDEAHVFHNTTLKEKHYQAEELKTFTEGKAQQFLATIQEAYKQAGKQNWQESPQIQNLLAMANPQAPIAKMGKLKYMHMGMSIRDNEFVQAKKEGMALPDYAGIANPVDDKVFPRKSVVQLTREVEAKKEERKRKKEEEARQQKLEKLSPLERSIEEAIDENAQLRKHLALLKALESGKWDDPDEQKQVAEEVKKFMQENKLWKETSAKKNPNKDKPYQATLKVMQYLG